MDPFFTGIDPTLATRMAGLSRQMFELRERRAQLLQQLDCADQDAVLAAIREGRLAEHPGYEAWLALALMSERQQAARELLDWHCRHAGRDDAEWPAVIDPVPVNLPSVFTAHPPEVHLDGWGLRTGDGLDVLARVLAPRQWSFEWRRGSRLWRLDTAPVPHPGIAVGEPHLHLPDGTVVAVELDTTAADRDGVTGIVLHALAGGRLPTGD